MFKEAIKHTLFMLPLLFWMVLALFIQPTVYIEQINLYIPNGYVMIAIMAATVIWNIILFIERSFGPFFWKLIFCLIPIELTCLIFFAQFHLVTAVILIAIWLIIHIALIFIFRNQFDSFTTEELEDGVPFTVRRRLSAIILAILLIIPSFMSIAVYGLDQMTLRPSAEAVIYDEDSFVNLVKQQEKQLIKLAQPVWEKLTAEEKTEVMQVLVNVEASLLDVEPVPVEVCKLEDKTLGGYTGDSIKIDIAYVESAQASEIINTVCHEVRHAYQRHVVEMLDWSDENVQQHYFYQNARSWKDNLKDYIDGGKDFDGYYGQSMERDARSWAEAHSGDYYYCLGINEGDVMAKVREILGSEAEKYE